MVIAYTHTQTTPSALWLVTHNFGRKPISDVVVNNSGQEKILPRRVIHLDDNQMQVEFAIPRTGTVRVF